METIYKNNCLVSKGKSNYLPLQEHFPPYQVFAVIEIFKNINMP